MIDMANVSATGRGCRRSKFAFGESKLINVSVFACFKAFFIGFRGFLSENSDCQIGNLFTVRRQCPFYFHPPLLKIFKRDGVLIFESKIKAAVAQAPLFSQDPTGFYV
ncbi:hypothetical protein [Pseudomonas putida]|uniref:Uncharacterized protein n=1 Tax=Pseudomonas putida TaxID=303 RepID=A0ABD7BEK5_PSEPU|nr:hypothetical protein [Pseudomonas putida]QOC97893.1 hypothetical protein ID616_28325 [Pseudomonas putida]QOD01467.1 hypothetical protein ID616_30020 [Pseudomonas putida]